MLNSYITLGMPNDQRDEEDKENERKREILLVKMWWGKKANDSFKTKTKASEWEDETLGGRGESTLKYKVGDYSVG